MSLIVVGAGQRLAPTSLRERLAVPADRLPAALAALAACEHLDEVVLLATCNRTEVYARTSTPGAEGAADREIRAFYSTFFAMAPAELGPCLTTQVGTAALNHLFRVACGLESTVLGEYEILGQVKRALAAATDALVVKPQGAHLGPQGLAGALRRAIAAGKRARTETAIGRGPVSLASGALVAARRSLRLDNLKGVQAVVVGAGQLGGLVARALAQAGVAGLTVVNRSPERAAGLARSCGGRSMALVDLAAVATGADLLVSAVGAPHPVLDAALLTCVTATRPDRPLVIVDLAMPRDVDPAAVGTPGLILHNLADAQAILEESLGGRRREVPKVEAIIATELASFLAGRPQPRIQHPSRRPAHRPEVARDRRLISPLASAQLG